MNDTDLCGTLEEISVYFVRCYMNADDKGKAKERFHRYIMATDEARKRITNNKEA